MIVVEKSQSKIEKILGKQSIKQECTYRLMDYVFRTEYKGLTVLHNMITGELVILEPKEIELLSKLSIGYEEVKELIEAYFLVPKDYDEHKQVLNLRKILRTLESTKKKDITSYTIIPTTACNARCYYCFEAGTKTITMKEKTADDIVKYITDHCGKSKTVFLSWFGGEPTVAANRIDQICEGLTKNGITYSSEITTNGYLLDEKMIQTAKELWHLQMVKISVDGTEKNYNMAKNYIYTKKSPYLVVMNNIKNLLINNIHVSMRLNFDIKNYQDLSALIQEIKTSFTNLSYLSLSVHPVIGEHRDYEGDLEHGTTEWFTKKIVELNSQAREAGLLRSKYYLPYLKYKGCQSCSESFVTITPEGNFVRCPEQFESNQVYGSIYEGIKNNKIVQEWKLFADYQKCKKCVFYPKCLRLINCGVKDRCEYKLEIQEQTVYSISNKLELFLGN